MCGLTGFVAERALPDSRLSLESMTNALFHRGPDDVGHWLSDDGCVGLGHRRLAILDLSAEGHQPMRSASGRYEIAFNGEIYNFQTLRRELEKAGAPFRGSSDTEVILAAIEHWGLERSLQRFVGMFAIALWDRQSRQMTLVRDRIGKKPLYYGTINRAVVFASELKAIRAFPGFRPTVDRGALTQYMRYGYIPAPRSIYEGIFKLEAGTFARFTPDNILATGANVTWYWRAEERHAQLQATIRARPMAEAVDELALLLDDAVRIRMVSDVPLGAFLSGGIDSSLIVSMMQSLSPRPVKTFTIGFEDGAFNESEHARSIAAHLGTEHHELTVTPTDTLAVIPKLPNIFDEPFSDPSQIPTYLVCAMARRDVTVALSGDGGDEGFCGYLRYERARRAWRSIAAIPRPIRLSLGHALRRLLDRNLDSQISPSVACQRLLETSLADRIYRRADVLELDSPLQVYRRLVSYWPQPASIVPGGIEPDGILAAARNSLDLDDMVEQMALLDARVYLPDDILVKVDRASMAVSLEARAPLLDHRVLEFAWGLPLPLKFGANGGKLILRSLLERYVPLSLFDRPKRGFEVPIASWLRGPLRDWAEHLLDRQRIAEQGFLNPTRIRHAWSDYLVGRRPCHYEIWVALMFQAWLEHNPAIAD